MTLEQQFELCLRLTVAALLSAAVGINRERRDHPAGLRTHILVGLGSALFTGLSIFAFPGDTPARIAAQIVTGIGFLGAGSIVQNRKRGVQGITTAAGIWTTAAIGMAAGAGLYLVATFATLLTWFVLEILTRVENAEKRRVLAQQNDKAQQHHKDDETLRDI